MGNKFLMFWLFQDFSPVLTQIFWNFLDFEPKKPQKLKKSQNTKSLFRTDLIFVCNLAKNGLIWVFWPKVISFFRFWNSNFFRGISYKDTRSFFIRKLRFRLHIEKYYTNLFSFLIFHTNCWRGYIYFLIDDFLIKKACTNLSNE